MYKAPKTWPSSFFPPHHCPQLHSCCQEACGSLYWTSGFMFCFPAHTFLSVQNSFSIFIHPSACLLLQESFPEWSRQVESPQPSFHTALRVPLSQHLLYYMEIVSLWMVSSSQPIRSLRKGIGKFSPCTPLLPPVNSVWQKITTTYCFGIWKEHGKWNHLPTPLPRSGAWNQSLHSKPSSSYAICFLPQKTPAFVDWVIKTNYHIYRWPLL